MKKRVRAYMRNGRNRRFWKRLLSVLSCVVVFVTTYALLLPAVTLEKTAACGMEAHQHDQSCFEQHLICGLEETDGHQHTDDCYTVNRVLACTIEEHSHTEECFNEEGELTCALAEHSHDDGCWREDRVLSCKKEETEPHHHTDACYESVLVCRKPVHIHSPECYVERSLNLAQYLTGDTTIYVRAGDTGDGANGDADSGNADGEITDGAYAVDGGTYDNSGSGWLRVDDTAEITAIDIVRLHYAYTIPAGTLTEGNQTLRYALPDNVRLTDDQIREVNAMNGGRGAQAVEGTRTPDQEQTGNEYVSAWILFENVYKDSDQKHKDPIGQILVLTFDAATIEKNRKVFGQDGALVDPGQEVSGFFSIDVNTDQISFDRGGDSDGEKETDVTLVEENKDLGIAPIRRTIRVIEAEEEQAEAVLEILNEEARAEEEFMAVEEDAVVEESVVSEEDAAVEENAVSEQDAVGEEHTVTEENATAVENSIEEEEPAEEAVDDEVPAEEAEQEEQEDLPRKEQDQEGKPSEEQAADSDKGNEEETKEKERTTIYQGVADTLTYEGADYTVTASYTEDAGIPDGASLVVSEITEDDDSKAYQNYRGQAEEAVAQEPGRKVSWIRLFDITIEKNGKPIEPQAPVSVQITYHEAMEQAADTTVDTVHFEGKKETPKVLETAAEGTDTATEQISFETDGFSVFAIVGTVIEKNVLASDGKNYKVTVTYGAETGIPEGAELEAEEILPPEQNESTDSEDGNGDASASSAYDEYVSKTENALGMEEGSAGYIRLFDIKIVDKDNPEIKYQPAEGTVVDVRIELADSESEGLSVVHFADEDAEGNTVHAETDGQTVNFEASGFSVYAIIDTADTDPSGTVSRKYEFYTDNTFGTPFTFVNKEGEVTSVQYVTEGGVLYNPDAPTAVVNGKQFVGWADENGTVIITPGTEGAVISGISGTDTVVRLYPRYDDVYYIEYYDEHHNIFKTESSVDGDFTMNGMTASLMEGGEYRIIYQPDDSEEAFMGWSLEDHSLNTVTQVDFTGDADRKIEMYPAKAKVFWINFDKNDAGGTSKATYTAPLWVLQTDDKVSDRHTSLPELTRPGYQFGGWYTDPECTTPFNMNSHLTGDITLYANWIPADQTYTVVILKQRISDSVTATAEEKTYDYETSYAIHGTTGGVASVPNQYKNLNYDGFDYARCDANTTIAADGSTVLYVYYDRKIVTFNFYLYGNTGATINYTTINENQANTNYSNGVDVYGDYQGNKVALTRTTSSSTRSYLSQYNYNGAPEYTDTVYVLRNGSYVEATEPYSTNTRYYYRYYDGFWPFGRYRYSQLNWRTETTTTYTWHTPDGNVYNGNFYRQTEAAAGTRWYIWKTMTGLYGSSLNGEWPSEYWWYSSYSGSTGNGTRTTFLDAFLPSGTETEVNFYGNTGTGTSSIRFYQQNTDGETYSLPSGGTVTSSSNATFNLTDKYNGFHIAEYRTRRNGTWSSWTQPGELMLQSSGSYYYDANPDQNGYQNISSGFTDLEIRYDRNTYTIDFLDGFNHSNTELADSASVLYGCSVADADPGTPDVTHEGYTFTGWYTDPDCKNPFDFSTETMPANNLVLYAGWEKMRFRVWVQPNGGVLSPTESTFFRSDYGELIQEYSDVEMTGRDYYASDDGEYSYIYICDPENHDQARVAYYKKTSELGVITLQKEDENGNIINDVYDESEWTDGKHYSYQKGVYDFVGWYRVDGDISEEYPPEILESDDLTLWNFNTPVTEPIALRAIWKRVGSFRVGYDKNMYDEEGNEIVLPGADNAVVPPTTLYTYGDLSQAIVGSAPTVVPENYTFVGWRTPAGEIVQPNDTITIHSSLATLEDGTDTSDPKYVYMLTAVYKQIDVTSLAYDANGGAGTLTDLNGTASESEDAVYGTNEITKLELNSKLNLSNGTGFTRENYRLIGWNDDKDAADNEIVKYELGGTYGIDNPEGNTLFAVWELLRIPVPFIKQGEKEDGAYEQLANAEFKLYTDEECTVLISDDDAYKKIIKAEDAIVTSSDEEGINATFPKVPVGTFYFRETSVDTTIYKLDSTVHTIVVTEENDSSLSYTIDGEVYTSENPFVIKNYRKGTLVVTKTVDSVLESDSTKAFSFTATVLNDDSEQVDSGFNGTYGDVTFENGVATFTLTHGGEKKIRNLGGKTIRITENDAVAYKTTATTGSSETGIFDSGTKTYSITVPENGDKVHFTNKLEGIPIKIVKIDQADQPLAGATFNLTGNTINESSLVSTLRTVVIEEGENLTEALIYENAALTLGDYTLTETVTPAGYIPPEAPVIISVENTESGITVSATVGGTAIEYPKISKDQTTGEWTIKITNQTGYELPSTGGPGTNLIYLIGIMLTGTAGAGLVMRKRRRDAA